MKISTPDIEAQEKANAEKLYNKLLQTPAGREALALMFGTAAQRLGAQIRSQLMQYENMQRGNP